MVMIFRFTTKKLFETIQSMIFIHFRHESEKQHAMAIKGPKIDGKDTWPEIRISDATAYAASIWIQLVEKENKKDSQPRPSPNGLFLKKDKNGHVYSPNGIEIHSDGNDDGEKHFNYDYRTKLPISFLSL